MKITIVEDSYHIRKNLIRFISKIKGAEIIGEAEDVEYALKLIEDKNPDIIILDIELKNSNGFDLLNVIKSSHEAAPIIMIFTNLSSISCKEKALKEKADYFFDKTNDFEDLIITIESLIKAKYSGQKQAISL